MPHTIRLRGPWTILQSDEEATNEQASSAASRLAMPCSVQDLSAAGSGSICLARRFQRPTGLTASSSVTLCVEPSCARNGTPLVRVVAIVLNDERLATLPLAILPSVEPTESEETPPWRLEIAKLLQASNLLCIEVELGVASAQPPQSEFGNVWLEIRD